MTRILILILIWTLVSAAWMAAVAYLAMQSWPHLSLDLSHVDSETQAAYNTAVMMHVAQYALVAVGVPLAVLAIAWFLRRSGARQN